MTFQRAFYFFTWSTALWAFLTLALFAELHLPAVALFLVLFVLAALHRRLGLRIPDRLWLLISLSVLFGALYGWFVIQERLYSVVYTFFYLELNKLWTGSRNRDYLQIYGLTFFQMLAASVSTASLLFAPALLIYLFLILGALVTVTIKKDAELAFTPRNKGELSGWLSRRVVGTDQKRLKALSEAPYLTPPFTKTLGVVLAAIIIIGSGIFFVIPRLQAKSFVTGLAPSRSSQVISGFSDSVDFTEMGEIQTNPAIVARAIPEHNYLIEDGYPLERLLRLRGTSLDYYDGRGWKKGSAVRQNIAPPGRRQTFHPERLGAYSGERRTVRTTIQLEPNSSNYLFAPGEVLQYSFSAPHFFEFDPISDSVQIGLTRWSNTLQYEVESNIYEPVTEEPKESAREISEEETELRALLENGESGLPMQVFKRVVESVGELGQRFQQEARLRDLYLQLPDHNDIATVERYAEQWTAEAETPLAKARAIEFALKSRFGYTLDIYFASLPNHLAFFLTEAREGHCEYFATAMALMLRTQNIPARIVNGYATDEWITGNQGYWIVRQAHAHAWVEAWLPEMGWVTFDPTPPGGIGNNRMPGTLMRSLTQWLDSLKFVWYNTVIDYDSQDQRFMYYAIFRGMDMLSPDRLLSLEIFSEAGGGRFSGTRGKIFLAILAIVAILAVLLVREIRTKRQRAALMGGQSSEAADPTSVRIEPYVALLEEAQQRVERRSGQTPLEYARRVVVHREDLGDFLPLTQIYYSARFNGHRWDDAATERANALLRTLRQRHQHGASAPEFPGALDATPPRS